MGKLSLHDTDRYQCTPASYWKTNVQKKKKNKPKVILLPPLSPHREKSIWFCKAETE